MTGCSTWSGDARFVLIGEASHGTHEFYRERARITRRLIEERGFTAVAVEADWPDAYRINRYVRGTSDDPDALAALGDFQRFPRWMWRNADVLEFVEWLRDYNDALPSDAPRGRILRARSLQPAHARSRPCSAISTRSIPRALCAPAPATPASITSATIPRSTAMRRRSVSPSRARTRSLGNWSSCSVAPPNSPSATGDVAEDEHFFATQNARLAKNAEAYYRAMFYGRIPSWNLRDRHMAETLAALVSHLERHDDRAKVVVWAHNSHLGDARATAMVAEGELNLGQLVRERYGRDAVLVGFTTYSGTVTAATNWDEPALQRRVRPALPGSYEALFHEVGGRSCEQFPAADCATGVRWPTGCARPGSSGRSA